MKGFSLIEVLMALGIMSIVGAFCMPIYSQHVAYEKRIEAEIILNNVATAMEQYYLLHGSYENATLPALGFPEKVVENRYQIQIALATTKHFKLQATPLNQQAKVDTECATLILNSDGEKSISGKSAASNCWLVA